MDNKGRAAARPAVAGGRALLMWVSLGVCSALLVKSAAHGAGSLALLALGGGGRPMAAAAPAPMRRQALAAFPPPMPSPALNLLSGLHDSAGHLPGVNTNSWPGQARGPSRPLSHPRRPARPGRAVESVAAQLAHLKADRARLLIQQEMLQRKEDVHRAEQAHLASLQARRDNTIGPLAALPSKPQPTTQRSSTAAHSVQGNKWSGGALSRTATDVSNTGGSLSPAFDADASNTNGALAGVHSEANGWAQPANDDGWAAPVRDNGWAAAVHDDGWASSPSRAAAHGALMSVKSSNPMGSLEMVKGRQDGWLSGPSPSEDTGSLANSRGGNALGSLAHTHGGNPGGSLSAFESDQGETGGSLAGFADVPGATDGILAGVKAGNSAGSLAKATGSDTDGSLADVRGPDMADGVLSVPRVGGSRADAAGSHGQGVLAATKGREMVRGALGVGGASDASEMVGGSLTAVHSRLEGNGWLARAPGLRGRLAKRRVAVHTASRGRPPAELVKSAKEVQKTRQEAAAMQYMLGKELSAAAKKRDDVARAKAAAAAEAAAERSTEHAAEKKLTAEEQQLERELAASRLRVESVEARLNRKALLLKQSRARRVRAGKAHPAGAGAAGAALTTTKATTTTVIPAAPAEKGGKHEAPIKQHAAAGGGRGRAVGANMHVASGQKTRQQAMEEEGDGSGDAEGESSQGQTLDDNGDDVGWRKKHWSTVAWVMFIMFGPVFTTAVVGTVGYYTGTVAALATFLLLVCMDIACYYYSWFLY